MQLTAIIHSEDDGRYWGEFPALPGCVSQGDTVDELAAHLKEAAAGWMEVENESAERERPSGSLAIQVEL